MTAPYRGDIRICNPERDAGKDISQITDFEVWDGARWVHSSEAANIVYPVELPPNKEDGS